MTELFYRLWDAPTATEWYSFGFVLAGLASFIGAGELVRHVFRWPPEFTRKLVHISVGILIFFAPGIFTSAVPAMLLSVVFIIVNLLAIRFGFLKGMHDTNRPSYGTVYYPLAFLILVIVFWHRAPMILSLSILVMALGDAAAAIVGETIKSPAVYYLSADRKSLQGSAVMLLVSFLVLFFGIPEYFHHSDVDGTLVFAAAGVAAMTGTAWEGLSSRGLDNLTIPLSVAFVLSSYLIPGQAEIERFTMGAILALLLAGGAWKMGVLAPSGAVATFLLALLLFGTGGWKWTVPILTFFVLSSILSRVGKKRKQAVEGRFEKDSVRDYGQVFANGGIAGVLALLNFLFPSFDLYPVYLGSIAAVTADTWGTEIGLASKGTARLVTTWKPVEPGTNGGITAPGLLAGFVGSVVIVVSAFPWIDDAQILLPIVILAGVGGSLVDSVAGATVQAEYRCPVCGKATEKRAHCNNQPTHHRRGVEWITNDVVNWVCGTAGALFALTLLQFSNVFEST
ncbi:MAG TPA: DUF92 domain-containing protein [Bacteroidota bacterium]|nr:DUF92 domain-containing protein [Bacteroidota bacterium]